MDFVEREKTEYAVRGITMIMQILPFLAVVIGAVIYFVLKSAPVAIFSTPLGEIHLHHFVVIIFLLNVSVAYGILHSVRSKLEKKLEIT